MCNKFLSGCTPNMSRQYAHYTYTQTYIYAFLFGTHDQGKVAITISAVQARNLGDAGPCSGSYH